MPNEPAEDRSVRGNTIKPAKVEPEQRISGEYLDGELGLKSTVIENVRIGFNTNQKLVDTGITNRKEVFSVQVVHANNESGVIYNGEVSENVDTSDDAIFNELEYATVSGDGEFGLNNTFYVLLRYLPSSGFSDFNINVLHF